MKKNIKLETIKLIINLESIKLDNKQVMIDSILNGLLSEDKLDKLNKKLLKEFEAQDTNSLRKIGDNI